jgi:hypothetical protein
MEAILARRFALFNFYYVPDFPNVVPTMDEWGDFLPTFIEHRDDNPAKHLLEFHELMHQWGIHHEDLLMNMFMYSLEGDAHKWYQSCPLLASPPWNNFMQLSICIVKSFIPLG